MLLLEAAGHKLPGKSSLNVSFVHNDNGDDEEVGSYMKKVEVVHKEVRGCTQGSWRLSHLI